MTPIEATYHDGESSAARTVRIRVEDGLVHVDGDDVSTAFPVREVRLESRLGNLPRRLDLPNGASCHVPADFELPRADDAPARIERWVNEAEIRWMPAVIAAVVVLVGGWATVVYGVPAAADVVARRTSPSVERTMGEQSLATLDRIALEPSKLPPARQQQLTARFTALVTAMAPDAGYVLQFRAGPAVGPNAFALPGGTVVLLDELVALAQHDDEIVAVLAHEVGHLEERHTLRQVLQTSAAGVLLAAVVGDVVSATSIAAALPATVLNASYSRAFEREADRFGFAALDRLGVDRGHFSRLLTRIEQKEGGSKLPGWISTHPRPDERTGDAAR